MKQFLSLPAMTLAAALALFFVPARLVAQPALSIRQASTQSVELVWPNQGGSFVVERTASLAAPINWETLPLTPVVAGDRVSVSVAAGAGPQFYRLRQAAGALTTLAGSSPAPGESGVAVTRETIFRLSGALASDTLLATNNVYAVAGGRRMLSRVELSGDRRTVTLFYLERLPADARVEVTFDGTGLFDGANLPVDLDGNGIVGGAARLSFQTLSTAALSTTGIEGRVFASEKNADGSDRPLRNVTITVDGMEETLRATTDANGFFRLVPCPAGRFFVSVDGRTAEGSRWPGGAYYPFVGKAWEAAPGRTNNLAGGSGVVYLPLIQADALQVVSATSETIITFAPAVLAANPALTGVEISVPPNALFSDSGARGGQVGIAPVPFDRLPEPLPPGLNLPLVITIQTDGPSNFDVPVPVKFPNLPDPITGIKLGPGEKTALWSFNHDTGRWEIQGSMTISADGQFAVSDPGVGVRQPGWHGSAPGSGGGGPGGPVGGGGGGDCTDANSNGVCDEDDAKRCETEKLKTIFAGVDAFIGFIPQPDMGPLGSCLNGGAQSTSQAVRDCGIDPSGCRETVATKILDFSIDCGLSFVPSSAAFKSAVSWAKRVKGLFDVGLAYANWELCQDTAPAGRHSPVRPHAVVVGGFPTLGNPFLQQYEVEMRLHRFIELAYGNARWAEIDPTEWPHSGVIMAAIRAATQPASPGGKIITSAERASILALKRPAIIQTTEVEELIQRMEKLLNNETPPGGDPDAAQMQEAVAALSAVLSEVAAAGWERAHDGWARGAAILESLAQSGGIVGGAALAGVEVGLQASSTSQVVMPARPLHYLLVDLQSRFEQRGRLNSQGRFDGIILRPQAKHLVVYFDATTLRSGVAYFTSSAAGRTTVIPGASLVRPPAIVDTDNDGLSDVAEIALGTSVSDADTDGDGISDGVEISNGTNPLDGQPLGLGVVATRDTPGTSVDIDTVNDFAVVADSTFGLAVFDVANPLAPVLVSQFTQTGRTFDAVATSGEYVAAIPGSTTVSAAGVQIFSLGLDGNLFPRGTTPLGNVPKAVAAAGRYAYVPSLVAATRSLAVIRLADSLVLRRVAIPDGAEVTELAVDHDVLWALSNAQLSSFRIAGDDLVPLARVALTGLNPSPLERGLELTAGNGRVYVGEFRGFRVFDGTNPANPALLFAPATTQAAIHDLALNGSGLMLPVTSFAGANTLALSAYDVRNDRSTNFLTSFDTPGQTRAVALHRGYALTADGPAGLATVNFLAPDRGTNPPTIALRHFPTHGTAGTEADELFFVSTVTSDDVQVRDVEFSIDGVAAARSGKFPFAASLRAPALTAGRTFFRLRARAIDTGGNSTLSDEVTITLLPDMTPPYLISFSPAHNSTQPRGSVSAIAAQFDSTVNLASLQSGWTLVTAGPDANLGTADDVTVIGGEITFDTVTRRAARQFSAPLLSGRYRARLAATVADPGGNSIGTAVTWDFTIPTTQPVQSIPADAAVLLSGALRRFEVRFDERLAPASVTASSLRLLTNSATNPLVIGGGSAFVSGDARSAVLEFPQSIADGSYRLAFTPAIRDVYGSPVSTNLPLTVTVKGPAMWISDVDGLWQTASNWSGGVPITGDNVIIDRPNATPIVTLRNDATVTTLRSEEPYVLDGRALTVRSNAVFNGPFTWNGQTRLNGGLIEWRGGVVASGAANKFLAGTTVRNAGLFDWRHGGILLNFPGAEFHNLPGAVFLMNKAGPPADTSGFVFNGANATGFLRNEGTFRKAGGAEAGFLDGMGFLNTGLIDVTHGTLELGTFTTNAGAINVAAGTRLVFGPSIRGGTFTQLPSGRITGEGTISMEVNSAVDGDYDFEGITSITTTRARFTRSLRSKSLVVSASSAGAQTDLVLEDGAVVESLDLRRRTVGAGELRVLAPAVFSRMMVGGAIVVRPEADFVITNAMVLTDQARLENRTLGRVENGTTFAADERARFENMPGATLHLLGNARLQSSLSSTQSFLHNAGWIRKSSGTNEALILGSFANDGRVTVETGGLGVESGGVHTGAFETEAGTTLVFRQASLPVLNEFTATSAIRGAAPVTFTKRDAGSTRPLVGVIRGALEVPRLIVSNSRLFLSGSHTLPALEVGGAAGGADLELDGDLVVTDELILQAASFQLAANTPAVTVRNRGTAHTTFLSIPTGVTVENRPHARFNLGSRISTGERSLFHNQPGATFTMTGTNALLTTGSIVSTSTLPGALWNEGTFLTASNGVHSLALNITNTGLMELRTGTVEVSSAQLFQTGGELRLDGAQLNLRRNLFTERPPLVLSGGELTGTGSVGFSSTGGNITITNLGCTIKPGLPLGVLNFPQRLNLDPGSTVELDLGGTTPGTEHDQLVVDSVRLGGVLRLRLRGAFAPAVGDTFTVLTFRERLGTTFASIEGQNIGGGKRLETVYEFNRVLVRCVAAP